MEQRDSNTNFHVFSGLQLYLCTIPAMKIFSSSSSRLPNIVEDIRRLSLTCGNPVEIHTVKIKFDSYTEIVLAHDRQLFEQ